MAETRIAASLAEIGRDDWDALFPGCLETWDYLMAVEEAALEGFRWRYILVLEGRRPVAAAAAFLTEYALETTLAGPGRRFVASLRKVFPAALTLRLACLGSPVTETVGVGFAPDVAEADRPALLKTLLAAFERAAAAEGCGLLAVKDVPLPQQPLWNLVAGRAGYRPIAGQPSAQLAIDFADMDAYLSRLSYSVRKDMRRKLKARSAVRIEVREDLGDMADQVLALYRQTRARAEMQFEDLTADYFTGVTERMGARAFYVLYFQGADLLAANLLLQDDHALLDKFFCMDAARGRPLNLYFLSWFTNVGLCLERGLIRYDSGQAAYENKLRLGSTLIPTALYFRHRNRLVNGALQLVAPLFAPGQTARRQAA